MSEETTEESGLLTDTTASVATETTQETTAQDTTQESSFQFAENWREGIPQEFREEPSLKAIPDIPTLMKNYVHAQKAIGKKGVPLPDQHATEDEKRAFFQQLGLPTAMEQYELSAPEDAAFEDGFLSQFKETAYKANILPDQASELLKWYSEANSAAMDKAVTDQQTKVAEELQALKNEWGRDYDNNLELGKSVLRALNNDGVNSWLRESGLDNSTMMIKLMTQIGHLMKEDGVIDVGNSAGPSSKDLQSRISELEGNLKGPLYDRKHPSHREALKERDRLYQQLYPQD